MAAQGSMHSPPRRRCSEDGSGGDCGNGQIMGVALLEILQRALSSPTPGPPVASVRRLDPSSAPCSRLSSRARVKQTASVEKQRDFDRSCTTRLRPAETDRRNVVRCRHSLLPKQTTRAPEDCVCCEHKTLTLSSFPVATRAVRITCICICRRVLHHVLLLAVSCANTAVGEPSWLLP